jgi:predicted signal transduction protein with EAL and GGDEF domain
MSRRVVARSLVRYLRTCASGWDRPEWDERAGQVLADVAAAYLYNAQARVDVSANLARLTHRSLHDPLTGLPNRALFEELLEQAVARARRSHHRAAVLFIDLDRFKAVNDRHGHHVGDELLTAVSGRIGAALRPGDCLARLGGDEFVVLCEDLAGPGQDIPEELLRDADHAMYSAKRSGGARRAVVVPGARLVANRRHELEGELSQAQRREELVLHYQPIVDVRTGRPTGVEALLRWEHPIFGTVLPEVVVAGAERTGMILPIGEWVLRQTCLDVREWRSEHPDLQVMVNVSAQQVTGPDFVRTLDRVLRDTALEPRSLCLEVTESVLLHDAARSLEVLRQVKQLGVSLSLDDFGTGCSSLSYLRQFPFDVLNIDRSFTQNVLDDDTTRSIVLAMIDLVHVLDLTITAEGVETAAEMESVIELGADHAQGFYISRPKPKASLVLTGSSGAAAPTG